MKKFNLNCQIIFNCTSCNGTRFVIYALTNDNVDGDVDDNDDDDDGSGAAGGGFLLMLFVCLIMDGEKEKFLALVPMTQLTSHLLNGKKKLIETK